jgi:DNA-binding winged helix-turn-helix (wHTH) protein/pimeloyl-ACP methyl ester carboxylesterase
MHTVSPRTIGFGIFTLDLPGRSLLRGNDEIRLRPKSFDVLRYLVEHAGRLVSKEELIQAIWPDVFVTEDSVVQCIGDIRTALADDVHRIIKTVPRRGYLFAAELSRNGLATPPPTRGFSGHQEITFCRTEDGVNLAVARAGKGKPVVLLPNWLTNLEIDWQSPIRGPLCHFLAERFQLVRYDGRGFGLSDRNVTEISFATLERDLEAVIGALGLQSCILFGISQAAATAIAHAARYPTRVSKLVLHGGFALGRNKRGPREMQVNKVVDALMREGWRDEKAALLRLFSSFWFPGASPDQIRWYANLLQTSTSIENAQMNRATAAEIDIVESLPKVSCPTLVLHCRHDNVVSFEEGRRLASSIRQAKFVGLDSENHVPLPGETAWHAFMDEIGEFLTE